MRLLLDTHIWIWYVQRIKRCSVIFDLGNEFSLFKHDTKENIVFLCVLKPMGNDIREDFF